jgi:hypothetical protein
MVALGNQGGSQRWFGPALEDGVHLRWAFRPELGFPFGGFSLSRRPHVPGTLVDIPPATGPVIKLPEPARRVTAEFTSLSISPGAPPHPALRLVALLDKVPVAADSDATVARGGATLTVEYDAIDAVRIEAHSRWRLQQLRSVPASQGADAGWGQPRSICLPLTHPNYPCHAGAVNSAADFEEARTRLAGQSGHPDPAVLAQYLDAPNWAHLHDRLRGLVEPPIPTGLNVASPIEGHPAIGIGAIDLMLIASVDPYVARVLGLYSWDPTAVPSQAYDYKLVGSWLKTQLKTPEVSIDFDRDRSTRRPPQTFLREGVIVRSFNRASVEAVPDTPWKDTRHALDLGPFADPGLPKRPAYLRIQFEEPVAEAQLYLDVRKGDPRLLASTPHVSASRWQSADGRFVVLTIGATNEDQRIEHVTLDPVAGTHELHVMVCKVGLLRSWSAPLSEPRTWVCYNVRSGPPAPLPAPEDLIITPVATPTRELANDALAAGPRVSLRWRLPINGEAGDVLVPRSAARYFIQRQPLGSAATPSPIDANDWRAAHDAPVSLSDADEAPSHLFLDEPVSDAASHQPNRFYAYRVAGVDLFGRLGPYSAPAIVDLADREPPPPPLDVEAEYLDPPDAGIRVRWAWPANRRIQAPDAHEFRVYRHPAPVNTIVGRATGIVGHGDGTFTMTTDVTLSDSAADAFAGDRLVGQGVSFVVLSNTGGADVQFVVRPPTSPPPVSPVLGPFTLPIRPPRSLEGVITGVNRHLNGTLTLTTDQTTEIAVNALAGGWLRHGGGDFQILGNTTGANLRITVRGRGSVTRVPGKGAFKVLEADQVAAVDVDPGNPLYVDYGLAKHWAARVHVLAIDPATTSYEAIIPADTAVPVEPVTRTQVAVSTADAADDVPDDPRWVGMPLGDRRGNEGRLSPPVLVQRALRAPISRPDAPDVGQGIATAADYAGRSFLEVRWQRPDGLRANVYRAIDDAIAAADRAARAARSTNRADYDWLTDEDFAALVAQQPAYDDLTDEALAILAGLPGNDAAFGLMTPSPVDADAQTVSVEGRSANRHCFAVRYVDAAGNQSALSWPSLCVRAIQTLGPRAPVVTKVVGGDRQIAITWASNRERDLTTYRIYRADSEEAARELKRMSLVWTELVAPGESVGRPASVTWLDKEGVASGTFFYRITAVLGTIESAPSAAVAGRAFDDSRPEPPVWGPPLATDAGTELTWALADAHHQPLVQRRDPYLEPPVWESITPWLPAGTARVLDTTRVAGRKYRYRLCVQDPAKRTNRLFSEVEF